jgi:hypothetical protein
MKKPKDKKPCKPVEPPVTPQDAGNGNPPPPPDT